MAGVVPPAAQPAALQELNRTLDRASADFGLPLISLIDRKGDVVVTTGTWRSAQPSTDLNLATRDYYTQAIAQGSAMQFLLGRTSRQPGLYFANRIEHDGIAVGVAVVKQDAETVNRLLKDADGSRILISDSNGVIVLGNQPDMLLKRLPGSPELPQAAPWSSRDCAACCEPPEPAGLRWRSCPPWRGPRLREEACSRSSPGHSSRQRSELVPPLD